MRALGAFGSSETALTADRVHAMSYVEFISLLQETNRCPGGLNTIRRLLQGSFVTKDSLALDIGSNTGYTSLEIARAARCRVIGIEPVQAAVDAANRRLADDVAWVRELVEFRVGTACAMPFSEAAFDLVVAGGATTFVVDRSKAISEYYRVLRVWGHLSVTQLYYTSPPPAELVRRLSKVLGFAVPAWSAEAWLSLIESEAPFERVDVRRQALREQPIGRVHDHVEWYMAKAHIAILSLDARAAIRDRWRSILSVFNENHRYLGFVSALFRKSLVRSDPELFTPAESDT